MPTGLRRGPVAVTTTRADAATLTTMTGTTLRARPRLPGICCRTGNMHRSRTRPGRHTAPETQRRRATPRLAAKAATSQVTRRVRSCHQPRTRLRSRFLTRDPLVASTRAAYSYAGDTALNATDPNGLGGHWYDLACQVGDLATATGQFASQHKVAIGIGLGILAAATGVGAVIEAAGVAGAIAAGATATEAATATVALGFVAAASGTSGFSSMFGVAGSVFDATTQLAPAPGCR